MERDRERGIKRNRQSKRERKRSREVYIYTFISACHWL